MNNIQLRLFVYCHLLFYHCWFVVCVFFSSSVFSFIVWMSSKNFKRTAYATFSHTHSTVLLWTNKFRLKFNQSISDVIVLQFRRNWTSLFCFVFVLFALTIHDSTHRTKHLMLFQNEKKIYYIINNNLIESELWMCVCDCQCVFVGTWMSELVRMYAFTVWFRRVDLCVFLNVLFLANLKKNIFEARATDEME